MSTKTTLSLIAIIGTLIPLSAWLRKTGSSDFIFVDLIASLIVLVLLFFAAFREQTTGDKSERVSPRAAGVVFCGIGFWVIFCFYRALAR
ncbi:MAG TPA: hypothetical protein VKU37_02790 [Verrucomicrobiae bacterium]|nr:hypothetical protein [Verrucomicrobiae bacterium]